MAKTVVLRTKTAFGYSGDMYDTTSEIYKIQDFGQTIYVENMDIPSVLKEITPAYAAVSFCVKDFSNLTQLQINQAREPINIDDGFYPQILRSSSNIALTKNGWIEISYSDFGSRLEKVVNGIGLEIKQKIQGEAWANIYSANSNYAPYVTVKYEEGNRITYAEEPKGYIDRTKSNVFRWRNTFEGYPVEDLQQTSAVIEWKNGEFGTVHTVSISGATKEYRMNANTLPASNYILWRVIAQTTEGQSTSAWTTVQTQDSISSAVAISPSASYVDGQKEMLFTWDHVTETGKLQTGYEIQYKTASSDWTTAWQESTANEYAYLPAGTLPSGSVTWRVRTYNAEGVAGAWSNELTIVVIAAPKAPPVSVSVSAPRPVISWQSREQQAFEVEIGDVKSGTIYGTGKSYQWPNFLVNGTQIARVRVLNEFGIWSPWGSTSFSVSNVPAESAVSVFGTGGTDAELAWNSITEASEYWVYRNDERIAKVSGTGYTDRIYLGTAVYFVRAVHNDGYNYTDSNRVTMTLSVDRAMITALDGDWLDIGHSLTSLPSVSETRSQDVAMMQYNGARLPIPEVSPFEQKTYSISCAFADRQMAARFDELLGRLCCVKDQYGNCMVGMIYSYTRVQNTFTTAYTATLYEVDRSAYEEN